MNRRIKFLPVALFFSLIIFSCQTLGNSIHTDEDTSIEKFQEEHPIEKITIPESDIDLGILDYLSWRGDLTFKQSKLNEVDAIIFAQLSYIHFNDIISNNLQDKKTIQQIALEFESMQDFYSRSYNGPFINEDTIVLLKKAALSQRFKNVELSYFIDELDEEQTKQFSAYTAFLDDGTTIVAYRGTHTELIGWLEDINMACEFPVPAHIRAVEYLEDVAKNSEHIIITGHSKGGNLALYAPTFCSDETKEKVDFIYNFDGQGFDETICDINDFNCIKDKVINLKPQSSVVGMIFTGIGKTEIVKSDEKKILFQHDPFSWRLIGTKFVRENDRTKKSYKIERKLSSMLSQLPVERRKSAISALYGVIEVSEANTLDDFKENWHKNSTKIIKYINSLDKQTREDVFRALNLYIKG